ncbi:glycosyltransferase family 61 protein [Jatrophihabitans sp.]|uniref:glycosyltransferase family 61 protein n=1 Tax=Jatrophihabitans sp. TaxID=1932789 RepID=UPI0030C729FD|nr:glycosyltransferase family 61 protein [Jatrophihabitans sp.]
MFVKRLSRRIVATVPGAKTVRATLIRARARRFLRDLAAFLPPSGGREFAILVPPGLLAMLAPWQGYAAGDVVHLLTYRDDPADVPTWITHVHVGATARDVMADVAGRIAPFDALLDLRRADPGRNAETWLRASDLVDEGGVYIVFPLGLNSARIRQAVQALDAAMDHRRRAEVDGRPAVQSVVDSSLLSSKLVLSRGAAFQITHRPSRFRFIGDDDVEVSLRDEAGVTVTILDELPAGTLTGSAAVVSHESSTPKPGLAATMPYPRLQLRHYEGQIEFLGQSLLIVGESILPDSHRFYRRKNNIHPLHPLEVAVPGRQDVVTIPSIRLSRPPLAGTYYLLDPQITGHYGHIMTEVIPRLWGWDLAKKLYPDLKTLTRVRAGRSQEPVLERLLTAYGIDREDIVLVDHPVQLESVITASAMWHNFAPHFAHPDLRRIWDRIAAHLVDPSAPNWDRLFLTRNPAGFRSCHNTAEVEAVFRKYGFKILSIEEYDLGVQAGIASAAKVVAGFGGSAMFNLMYGRDVQNVIVLNHEKFTARNEHLYASLLGAREDWFWSTPDTDEFHSGWTFDFDRNGADLEALLASL